MGAQAKILGHRGFSAKYPENTLLAFRKAFETSSDGIEFDVRLTGDGVPVVLHDATLERTTTGEGRLSSWPYEHISKLNAAILQPEQAPQSIPTLASVLNLGASLHPTGVFNIELKVDDSDWKTLADEVISVLRKHPLDMRVILSSFHHECIAYLKNNYPNYAVGLLFESDSPDPWALAKHLDVFSVHLDHRFIHRELVSACHSANIRVAAWTVDEETDIARVLRSSVDFVISNVPDTALRIRDEHALHIQN